MEEGAAASGSISQPPEPEPAAPPSPSPRGQKRCARPDEDDAAGDGTARGSPRRTVAEEEEEELDDARQLFDFFHHHAHPGAADADAAAAGSSSTAGREPVDVTLRLGVGHPADGSDGAVDTTLRLSSAVPALRQYCKPPVVVGAAPGAASNAETGSNDGQLEFACGAEADFTHVPPPPAAAASEDESFSTIDGFAAGDAAGRPSSGPDLNKPSPSACPDGSPDPYSHLPAPAPVVDDNLAAGVDERPAAVVEQRHRPTAPFIDFFCSPAQGARAPPGVLTADSS